MKNIYINAIENIQELEFYEGIEKDIKTIIDSIIDYDKLTNRQKIIFDYVIYYDHIYYNLIDIIKDNHNPKQVISDIVSGLKAIYLKDGHLIWYRRLF